MMIIFGAATLYGLYNEYQHSKNEVAYVVSIIDERLLKRMCVNRILLKTTCLKVKSQISLSREKLQRILMSLLLKLPLLKVIKSLNSVLFKRFL